VLVVRAGVARPSVAAVTGILEALTVGPDGVAYTPAESAPGTRRPAE
jgi:hypothetical protein